MNTHPPPSARRFRLAAELRAAGHAWERVAAEVRRPLAEVRSWPQRFPRRWKKEFELAERHALAAATAEAVALLRKQLRSENKKVVRDASMKLVQIRVALERIRGTPEADKPSDTPPGYADRLLTYVRGMTDEELAVLEETSPSEAR